MTFKSVDDATNAMKQVQERFEHAKLRLDYATQLQSPVLFIGDVSPTIRPQVLQAVGEIPGFERFFDCEYLFFFALPSVNPFNIPIFTCSFISVPARDGGLKEYLHASFADAESAQNAHSILTKAFEEQGVRVDYALNKAKDLKVEPRVDEEIPPSADLFIGNLSFHASEAEILSAFDGLPGFVEMHICKFKPCLSSYFHSTDLVRPLARDFNGRNRGFARATFDSVHNATDAMTVLNGKEVMERPMTATYSKLRPTRPAGLPTTTLFIGGLPHDVSENVIRGAVAGFEGLKDVKTSTFMITSLVA